MTISEPTARRLREKAANCRDSAAAYDVAATKAQETCSAAPDDSDERWRAVAIMACSRLRAATERLCAQVYEAASEGRDPVDVRRLGGKGDGP